jgi:hypothetical protein
MSAGPAAEQAAEHRQQQQQQPQEQLQQYKRRRLSDESSSSSSSRATKFDAAPAQQAADQASSPTDDDQQAMQQQQLERTHKHGPSVEGCSYKGNLLDPGLLLPPPLGWVPEFLHSDAERVWRGGRIAPLGANLVLVLYGKEGVGSKDSSSSSSVRESLQEFRVRLVYNEQVLPLPGCSSSSSNGSDCSLQEFLDVVVGDKISYERFRRLCDGDVDVLLAAEGLGLSMHGTLSSSSSSSSSSLSGFLSSSSTSTGSGRWAGLSAVALQDSPQGLQLETADGLPLLLPAEGDDSRPAAWD